MAAPSERLTQPACPVHAHAVAIPSQTVRQRAAGLHFEQPLAAKVGLKISQRVSPLKAAGTRWQPRP